MADAVTKLVNQMLNPSGLAYTPEEAAWACDRMPHERTPIPDAGQPVWYRHTAHGPLVDAVIEYVELENRGDFGVWRFVLDTDGNPVVVNGSRVMDMVDDPWVDVVLRTADGGRVATREARLPGSPGWLPKKGASLD